MMFGIEQTPLANGKWKEIGVSLRYRGMGTRLWSDCYVHGEPFNPYHQTKTALP
jgi:hypothetical protein